LDKIKEKFILNYLNEIVWDELHEFYFGLKVKEGRKYKEKEKIE